MYGLIELIELVLSVALLVAGIGYIIYLTLTLRYRT